MWLVRYGGWLVALAVGLVLGVWIGGSWWNTPLAAVATDRSDKFTIATGFVDEEVEALYFLDHLSGTLRAAVVSNRANDFQAIYEANVYADLNKVIQLRNVQIEAANAQAKRGGGIVRPLIQVPQTPSYMMVTGLVDIRRGPAVALTPSRSAVYVAETNTGIVLAYVLPWSQTDHAANRPARGPLTLWAGDQFTTAVIRTP